METVTIAGCEIRTTVYHCSATGLDPRAVRSWSKVLCGC